MKALRRVRIFEKLKKTGRQADRGVFSASAFRMWMILSVLFLLLCLSAQTAFADRTVYVMSKDSEKSASSEAVKASSDQKLTPKTILKQMTLEQKIAQMLMPSVRDEDGGGKDLTELTPVAREAIEKYSFCGYLFFSQNCQGVEQMTRLTSAMQRAAVDEQAGIPIPLLLAVDQEGGRIERVGSGTLTPGNMALGAIWDEKAAESAARIIGSEMHAVGFNVDCAPVVDVNSNPKNPVINLRSFGSDADLAADLGTGFVRGLDQAGVAAMLKHFPGHGDTATDSHTGLPIIDKTLPELEKQELIPFQAGIDAGAGMIMTAHIEFPQVEKDTYTSRSTGKAIALPATLSDDILTGVLRERMGFDGVIVTDAIKMDAIRKHFDLVDAAELAINAGVDIILNPGDITTEKHVASLDRYIHQIAARVENGTISEASIDEAVLRILNLKEQYGLLDQTKKWRKTTDSDVDGLVKTAEISLGSEENENTIRSITERSTTLLKNDHQTLPVSDEKTVILCPEQEAVASVQTALKNLTDEGILKKTTDVTVVSYAGLQTANAASYVADAKNVIAISVSQSPTSVGKGSSAVFLRTAVSAVHKNGGKFILISGYLPYDVAAFQESDAILVSYGYKSLTEIPKDKAGEEPDYGPNLPAAIGAAFGAFIPSGSLPVEIPRMDANYNFTDQILYLSGYGIQNWNQEISGEVITQRSVESGKTNENEESSESGNEAQSDSSGSGESEEDSVLPVSPLKCGLAVIVVLKYLFV